MSIRDTLTRLSPNIGISDRIAGIVAGWRAAPASVQPYLEMRDVLEEVRRIPPGNARVRSIHAILAALGRPDVLATFLDALRDSVCRNGTVEQEASRARLLNVRMHSIYGWCGNTLTVESLHEPSEGTSPAPLGLAERLGNAAAAWNLTVHIWQPNALARGFPASGRIPAGSIVEPPHSHPFDFMSTVVKGELHQSIYSLVGDAASTCAGYYDGIALQHVDGIWPRHAFRETVRLRTLEHRVRLRAGDIYYMPSRWIHDVEIDAGRADRQPTITLFLSTEYIVMPDVYMIDAMADFHEAHPEIKSRGAALPEARWHDKLKAIAEYLRGRSDGLDLNEIVGHDGEYAFFHLSL
ncbi:MAG TPA: hypothetical protein VGC35_06005 [Allosphingosinicella sp.]|jgi:hypothetical protein